MPTAEQPTPAAEIHTTPWPDGSQGWDISAGTCEAVQAAIDRLTREVTKRGGAASFQGPNAVFGGHWIATGHGRSDQIARVAIFLIGLSAISTGLDQITRGHIGEGAILARRGLDFLSQGADRVTREITEQQARAVLRILVEHCGHRVIDPRDGDAFVRAIIAPQPDGGEVCREYRFCGALGFGRKFRNNGNNKNVPYVDCYSEDETPARIAMIDETNTHLAVLFGAAP